MRRLTPREIVLLVIVAVSGIGYLWYASNRAMSARSADFGAGDRDRLADKAPFVPMDLLARTIEDYDRQGRDLFKYSKRPPTQAELDAERRRREAELEAQRAAAEAKRRANEAAARRRQTEMNRAPAKSPPPDLKQPPRIPFEYIGYLGPKNDRIAVFQEGEELLLAQRGEQLQEMFKVVEIRYESVVMGYTDPEFETRTRELPLMSQ